MTTHDIKDVINSVFLDLKSPQKSIRATLIDKWPEIAGPTISGHTKPTLYDGGRLVVWVDQAPFAFELRQRYQQALLKRVQAVLGEDKVKTIRFYVGQIR